METKIKIGIPRALLYYKYQVFWKRFFEKLNCEVLISPETNREIMNRGVNLAVDESCLSLKIFLGHVNYLKDKVDYIFLPHIVSVQRGERICVKLMALYDIAVNTFENIKVIEYTVDVDNFKTEFLGFMRLGWRFNKNPFAILRAYFSARKEQKKYLEELEKIQEEKIKNKTPDRPLILIVSHPYTTYDSLLGKPITNFLESQGVNIIYSDIANHQITRKLSKKISNDLYWTYNKELLGAIELYKDYIDGIIFLMTFPCGPDSLVINLCQNKLKMPMTILVLDELQAETGLKTRLESFVDILKLRNPAPTHLRTGAPVRRCVGAR